MNAKKMLLFITIVAFVAMVTVLSTAPTVRTAETDDYLMYAGTYTGGASKGIYAFRFQPSTGKTVSIGLAVESANPSFLAVHPDRRDICVWLQSRA
jgi:6-phosphogluconolactonase